MYIIAGLGNPGKEYENTRHNIGFDVIDRFAEEENIAVMESKHKALIGKGYVAGQKVILAKPQTFMNLSGESIREIVDYYKVDDTTELIVISDDISLDVGQIRIRKKGSAGGHNGLKNIIKMLGHDTFIRVRMGVGEKPKTFDLADFLMFFLFFEIALKYLNLWVLLNILLKIVLNEKMFARSVILRRDLQ